MNERNRPKAKTHDALAVFQGVIKDLRIKNLAVRLPVSTRFDGGKTQLQPPALCWWYGDKVADKLREAGHRAQKSHLEMRIISGMLDRWSREPDARDEQVHQHWVKNPDRVNLKHADGMVRITVKVPNPSGTEIPDYADFSVKELRRIKEAFEKACLLYEMLRALKSDRSNGFLSFMDQFYRAMMDESHGRDFEGFIVAAMEEYFLAVEIGTDPLKLITPAPKRGGVKAHVEIDPPQLARGTGETPATAADGPQPTAIQKRLFAASGSNGAAKAPAVSTEPVAIQPGVKLTSLADLASLVPSTPAKGE